MYNAVKENKNFCTQNQYVNKKQIKIKIKLNKKKKRRNLIKLIITHIYCKFIVNLPPNKTNLNK